MEVNVTITALRGPTREQVEKVWRAKWEQPNMYEDYGDTCSNCHFDSRREPCISDFCPDCGCAMTNNALDMVMKRLEALYEDNS